MVIDVGFNSFKGALLEEIPVKKAVGDVNFVKVAPLVSAITPVPGGVGPMTVISLMENVFKALCDKIAYTK
ncbi:Bifunctional protein FolD protein [compost metagenome]